MKHSRKQKNSTPSVRCAFGNVSLIYRLAFGVFLIISLTPELITPLIKGAFPQNTIRGKICLLRGEEVSAKGFLIRLPQLVQMSYTLRFVHKANSFVEGQCPGGKMCAIGKYRRNVLSLKSTFWAALSGSIFPSLDYSVRFLTRSLSKWPAFYVNFIFLDSLLYLFYIILFLVSQVEAIPSVVETPRRTTFYVSKPRQLEPRRSYQPVRVHQSQSSPSKTDTGNVCNGISVENRQVQEPRAMIIYCSSNSCRLAKSSKNYPQSRCKKQKQKNQNCVKIDAKVISVSPSCPLQIKKAAKLETRQDVMGRFSYLSKI